MKEVTITSIYGKTLNFTDYGHHRSGAINVVYRDDDGNFKGGMLFDKHQVQALREALAEPVVPVSKPEEGVFFLMRQKKSNPTKVKVCFAPDAGTGILGNKEYHSRRRAEMARDAQNARHGDKWTYFIVEKETV